MHGTKPGTEATDRAHDRGRDAPADETPARLAERVRERAHALGFDAIAIARADLPLGIEHERYLAFVARGLHGTMDWLASRPEVRRRLDGREVLEGARSVVCVATRYARGPEEEAHDPPLARAIARYARGRDYHAHVRKRLRKLADFVASLAPGARARPLCDIEPVLERAWAQRAGLGFVGKNGLVIVPGEGSFLLLGEVVTTLDLPAGVPIEERCGTCTRCLDACPTQAFEAPFVLDPRRCIAYLTIESREVPPEPLRDAIGEHLFGCDVCQDVCPYNRTAHGTPDEGFRPLERWRAMDLEDCVTMDEATWDQATRGTPVRRAHRVGLARNAAIVAANRLRARSSDAPEACRVLELAARHDDAGVRAIAQRALSKAADEAGRAGGGHDETSEAGDGSTATDDGANDGDAGRAGR